MSARPAKEPAAVPPEIQTRLEAAGLRRTLGTRAVLEAKAIELFRDLALPDPDNIGQRYPHQVSGGQLQRVMAAMAAAPSGVAR